MCIFHRKSFNYAFWRRFIFVEIINHNNTEKIAMNKSLQISLILKNFLFSKRQNQRVLSTVKQKLKPKYKQKEIKKNKN